MGNENRQQVF